MDDHTYMVHRVLVALVFLIKVFDVVQIVIWYKFSTAIIWEHTKYSPMTNLSHLTLSAISTIPIWKNFAHKSIPYILNLSSDCSFHNNICYATSQKDRQHSCNPMRYEHCLRVHIYKDSYLYEIFS